MRYYSVSRISSLLALFNVSLCYPDGLVDFPAAPATTAPPSPHEVARALRIRQNGAQTCGWVSNNPSAPVTCSGSSFCAFDDTNEVFGCCANSKGCIFPTSCLDSTAIGRITDTDITLYCTQSTAAVCNYFYNDEVTSFFCGSSSNSFRLGTLATNQNGIAISTATQVSVFTPATSGSLSFNAPPTQIGGPVSISTDSPNPASGGSSGSNTTASGASGTAAPLSTGAVAGIAVAATLGGAAVLAAAGFFCWRSRQNKKKVPPTISQPHMQPMYNNMPPPPPPSGGNNPAGSSGYASAPMSYAPSPPGSQYPGVTHVQDSPSVLNPQNLNQHLRNQEWKGIAPNVAQQQTANSYEEEYDGLGHLPELRPQDAAGEPRYDGRASRIYSEAAQTAMHPASEAVWHQPV